MPNRTRTMSHDRLAALQAVLDEYLATHDSLYLADDTYTPYHISIAGPPGCPSHAVPIDSAAARVLLLEKRAELAKQLAEDFGIDAVYTPSDQQADEARHRGVKMLMEHAHGDGDLEGEEPPASPPTQQ